MIEQIQQEIRATRTGTPASATRRTPVPRPVPRPRRHRHTVAQGFRRLADAIDA